MYGDGLEGAQLEQDLLWDLILSNEKNDEIISKWSQLINHEHIKNNRISKHNIKKRDGVPPLSAITTQWFMTLFINQLPMQTTLRVVIFYLNTSGTAFFMKEVMF